MADPAAAVPATAPVGASHEGDVHRRIRIGLTGLGGVVAATLVASALVNRTAQDVMADMANASTIENTTAAARSDPLSEIGAAPTAEPPEGSPVEAVPGTGATVDPVTGNVSDLPPKRARR